MGIWSIKCWYAGKCQKIISAEAYENWYNETLRLMKKKSLKNFDLLLTKKSSEYVNNPIEKSDPKSRRVLLLMEAIEILCSCSNRLLQKRRCYIS